MLGTFRLHLELKMHQDGESDLNDLQDNRGSNERQEYGDDDYPRIGKGDNSCDYCDCSDNTFFYMQLPLLLMRLRRPRRGVLDYCTCYFSRRLYKLLPPRTTKHNHLITGTKRGCRLKPKWQQGESIGQSRQHDFDNASMGNVL